MQTNREWRIKKCPCSDEACDNFAVVIDGESSRLYSKETAQIISAALDSLEACEGLLKHSDEDEFLRPHQFKWIKKAKKAIEKARGER